MKSTPLSDRRDDLPAVVKQVILNQGAIAAIVERLVGQIRIDYGDSNVVLLGVLEGARPFCRDLYRRLSPASELDWIGINRYQSARGPRKVKIVRDTRIAVKGRHLLLVEDIVDTGLSLNYLIQVLQEREPASIYVCTLLDRPGLRLAEIPVRYVGENVSEDFLIGYGLDYQDRYRELPFIATMDLEAADLEDSPGANQ